LSAKGRPKITNVAYNFAKLNIANQTIDLTTAGGSTGDPCYVLLVTTGYEDIADTDKIDASYLHVATTTDSITHFEVTSGSMGSTARQFISQSTAAQDDTNEQVNIAATTAVTFSSVSSGVGDIGGAVIFAEIAASDSSGRIPIAFYDSGFPKTPNGGDIVLNFSTGWLNFASTS
jgi:hypothetical protein